MTQTQKRPSVVVILGHVDHGKTTLLSKIKQADLNKKEFGGISQHIGAYKIKFAIRNSQFAVTFIDTPGHVVFSQMRSRGVKVADLAILVVSADDGVKPQTLESLKHIKLAKIPFLVVINKIDLDSASVDKVKGELAKNGVLVEGYGGDIVSVPVSAKTGEGLDQLLEMIVLLTQMNEPKAKSQNSLKAVVIESRLDNRRGNLAAILIREGRLKIGDEIWAGRIKAKVKAIIDDQGQAVKSAGPSDPVQVLGFEQLPNLGVQVTDKPLKEKSIQPAAAKDKPSKETEPKLKIILKTDTQGTMKAILASFSDEVVVIKAETGGINKSDILLAQTTGAQLIGFNVKLTAEMEKLAEIEKVMVKTYQIIYKLLEDIEKKVLKILEPTIEETNLGEAEVLAKFEIDDEKIAGCRVRNGKINLKDKIHLKRGDEILADSKVKSLKMGKRVVEVVKKDDEFGAVLSPNLDFKIGDVLISYQLPQENGKAN